VHIAGHDCDAACVDRAQVGISQQRDDVRLGRLLDCSDGRRLEAEPLLQGAGHFTHEALEWRLAEQELGSSLVAADLAEGDGSGAESVSALDTALGGTAARLLRVLRGLLRAKALSRGLLCAAYIKFD